MFRPRLLLTSLAIALGACSPQDPQATTSATLAQQAEDSWTERTWGPLIRLCKSAQPLADRLCQRIHAKLLLLGEGSRRGRRLQPLICQVSRHCALQVGGSLLHNRRSCLAAALLA